MFTIDIYEYFAAADDLTSFHHGNCAIVRHHKILGSVSACRHQSPVVFALHGFGGGDELAVQVGYGHFIPIDENEGADTGTGQRFRDITAHAAETEHGHFCRAQALYGIGAEECFGAGKTVVHI